MTIATTVSSVTEQGNGAATLFNYDFLIPASTDVVVTVTDTTVDPTTTTTITSSQYNITGVDDANGGTVQYPLSGSPLAAGQYITISRVLPFIQTYPISNQGNFYPEVTEAALDYLMMCVQQLSTQIAAASFPDSFLGITGQTPVVVSQSGGQYVISLTPITSSFISAGAVVTASILDGAATLAKMDRTGATASVLTAQGPGNAPIWTSLTASTTAPPIRQTVLASAVDSSGYPNYIAAGSGLSVTISATSVNLFLTAANGFNAAGSVDRIGAQTTDTGLGGLTANSTNYLYADIASNGGVTFGKTTLAPVYQWGGPYSTTNGQFTFNIQEMVGKVGNGSTADQTYRVFIGECVTVTAAVSSVINYGLMGRWQNNSTALALGAATTVSHNLGIVPRRLNLAWRCTATDSNYQPGDIIEGVWNDHSNNPSGGGNMLKTANTLTFIMASADAQINKTSFGFFNPTCASWTWNIQAERGW
jgi:hypothetical protein